LALQSTPYRATHALSAMRERMRSANVISAPFDVFGATIVKLVAAPSCADIASARCLGLDDAPTWRKRLTAGLCVRGDRCVFNPYEIRGNKRAHKAGD
jgi:hypothetical protein